MNTTTINTTGETMNTTATLIDSNPMFGLFKKIDNFDQYKKFCAFWESFTDEMKAETKAEAVRVIVEYIETVYPVEFPEKFVD